MKWGLSMTNTSVLNALKQDITLQFIKGEI